MSGFTNKGKYRLLGAYRGVAMPGHFYLALVTSAVAPVADTNTLGELTQVGAGTGYTANGSQVNLNSTDFDVYTEDDANDRALIQLKNFSWTGSGGPITAARYSVLTDDNATPANREVWNYWSLGSDRTVSDGQTLTLVDQELDLTEA
jgi:hypothetical protein